MQGPWVYYHNVGGLSVKFWIVSRFTKKFRVYLVNFYRLWVNFYKAQGLFLYKIYIKSDGPDLISGRSDSPWFAPDVAQWGSKNFPPFRSCVKINIFFVKRVIPHAASGLAIWVVDVLCFVAFVFLGIYVFPCMGRLNVCHRAVALSADQGHHDRACVLSCYFSQWIFISCVDYYLSFSECTCFLLRVVVIYRSYCWACYIFWAALLSWSHYLSKFFRIKM